MIYADNAATTRLDDDAFEAMKPYLTDEYGNASQPYSFARGPKKALANAREIIAECINAEPDEIYFTSGGTESDNHAIKSILFSERKDVVTSAIEHHAVLRSCETLERLGVSVNRVMPDGNGKIDAVALFECLIRNTGLVSIMFANNEVGTIQPIADLVRAAHERGALFHTDAVQAVGHIKVDVKELDVDMLSASAHKFNGPRGVGFLYVKRGVNVPPYMDGGSQERNMRAGTENTAAIVGMSVALRKNCERLEENERYVSGLERTLLESLAVPFKRNGGGLPGLLSLSFDGFDGEAILHRLDLMGICVSTGSACDGKNTKISHVLTAMKVPENLARGTIRISIGKDNTIDDVKRMAGALEKIACKNYFR